MRGHHPLAKAAAVLGLALFAAACSQPAQAPAGQAPAGGGTGQQAQAPAAPTGPKYGGQVFIAQRDAPENKSILNSGRAIAVAFNHYYETLVNYDQTVDFRIDYPVIPGLAEKWEQPDDKTWVFTIRDGIKWHDGTPLTAEGVVWSMEHTRDPAAAFAARSNLSAVDKITAEGNKVKFSLKTPTAAFLNRIKALYVVPKHIAETGKDGLDKNGIGTGPFSLVSYDRNARTIFKKFPDYWQKSKDGKQLPYLDGMQVIHNMDASTQQAGFAARQLDFQIFPDRAQYEAFSKSVKDMKLEKYQYAGDPSLMINIKKPFLDKLEVRRALNLIIDRQEINANYAAGDGLFSLPGPAAMKTGYSLPQEELAKRPGWRADKKAEDLAEARRLLDAAGVPKDWQLTVVNYATYSTAPATEIAANQLKRFGINIKYSPLDDSSTLREYRAGNYDLGHQLLGNADPGNTYNNFHSKGSANYIGVNDPEIDRITEALQSTSDREQIKKLSRQFHDRFLDQAYSIGEVTPALYLVTQPWVNDYFHSRSIQPDIGDAAAHLWVDVDMLPSGRK